MATKQPKRPSYLTPKGVFKYPALTKPDYGTEEFPKPDGEFKVAVVLKMSAAVQALIDKLTPAYDAAIAEGEQKFAALELAKRKKLGGFKAQPFYEEEFDPETEEPTGNVIFKAKTKYRILDKATNEVRFNKIGLFDAKGKPLPAGTQIYGGTVGIISFTTRGYWVAAQGMAGLSLYLNAAQVIELVGPGNRSGSSFGFSEQEGYEAGDEDQMPTDDSGQDESAQGANGNPQDF